jgi:hypothetical protein
MRFSLRDAGPRTRGRVDTSEEIVDEQVGVTRVGDHRVAPPHRAVVYAAALAEFHATRLRRADDYSLR